MRTGVLHKRLWGLSTASSAAGRSALRPCPRGWWLLCCLWLAGGAHAQPDVELSIQPRLCALAAEESACTDPVAIRWHSPAPLEACLYISPNTDEPLTCWQGNEQGEHRYERPVQQSITFVLRRIDDGRELASQALRVTREDTQYRQRRRRPWHFF